MRNHLIYIIILLFASMVSLQGQQISICTISSGGGYAENASGSVSQTIGQLVFTTAEDPTGILTQGFQQPTCPPAGLACDDGDPCTINDMEDGNCGCVGIFSDTEIPSLDCPSDVTVQTDPGLCSAADVDLGSAIASDNCSGVASVTNDAIESYPAGVTPVIWMATDGSGNTASCTQYITVVDEFPPVANCFDSIEIFLDVFGYANIVPEDLDSASSDVCGIASLDASQLMYTCADEGPKAIILTVTDIEGNSSSCVTIVTITDMIPPVAVCQDITIQLDVNGEATISPIDIEGGSTDACGVDLLTLNATNTEFFCDDVGSNIITLTVGDNNTNESTCDATVTVEDKIAPEAKCQDVTVQLDAIGNGSITPGDVDNGSTDACGVYLALDQTNFSCADILNNGSNIITLTVTDVNGNMNSCTASVTVEDNVAPEALCQDVTIQLDAAGNGSILPAAADNNSKDACGVGQLDLSQTTFACAEVGPNPETLTVTDVNGNESTCDLTVYVEDNIAPTAQCQDVTIFLGANGEAYAIAQDVDNGSEDACGVSTFALSQSTFVCADLGPNTEVLTVTDANGNTNTCNTTVTVVDDIPPTIECTDITIELDESGEAFITLADIGSADDNCGVAIESISADMFNCYNVGTNTSTYTVTDANGNTTSCLATIVVEDNVLPTTICNDITVQLNSAGTATITAPDMDQNSSFDNCTIESMSVYPYMFMCDNVGANAVTLSIHDRFDNNNTCEAIVTVVDNVLPTMVCKDVTVALQYPNGDYTIAASQVDNGSFDACGMETLSVAPATFGCDDIGSNLVTLTGKDVNGNMNSCEATVTFEGNRPDVYISESELPDFCQGTYLQLTAISDEAVDYLWSTGETTETIDVAANGVYSVTVTSVTGCTDVAMYTVTGYDPGSLQSAYVILGFEEVYLHGNNTVQGGGVGVFGCGDIYPEHDPDKREGGSDDDDHYKCSDNEAKLKKYTSVNTFVQAPNIDIDGSSSAASKIYEGADVVLPAFEYNVYSNNNDLVVPNYANVTATANIYGQVKVGKGATITFTQENIYIKEFKTERYANVIFEGCANMHIDKEVKMNQYVTFNPTGQNVVMYVDDDVDVKYGSIVSARIFATKDIKVKGKKKKMTTMTGQFIGREVSGKDYVDWDSGLNCDPCGKTPPEDLIVYDPIVAPDDDDNDDDDMWWQREASTGIATIAYPNPFVNKAVIEFVLPETGRTTLEIISLSGEVVHSEFYGDLEKETKYTIEFVPSADLGAGTYVYRIISGKNIAIGKILLMK